MGDEPVIDTTYDVRADAGGRDPDTHSPTLRRYHRLLWSKPLPSGEMFDLSVTRPGAYLHHRSHLGEFFLASDSVMQTFTRWVALRPITAQLPDADHEEFQAIGYTIGGMMLFPGNRIDGKQTINGARGFTRRIADRMDLTLECIRRFYADDVDTPLGPTLVRYRDFFDLFVDFSGYVDFFLLQDLLNGTGGQVKFFMPFVDFRASAVPGDLETYVEFRRNSIAFIHARNARIAQWAEGNLEQQQLS